MPSLPRPTRCDICGDTRGRILNFTLIKTVKKPDGGSTTKSCGNIWLCQDCWLRGPALRKRMWKKGQGTSPRSQRRRQADAISSP